MVHPIVLNITKTVRLIRSKHPLQNTSPYLARRYPEVLVQGGRRIIDDDDAFTNINIYISVASCITLMEERARLDVTPDFITIFKRSTRAARENIITVVVKESVIALITALMISLSSIANTTSSSALAVYASSPLVRLVCM